MNYSKLWIGFVCCFFALQNCQAQNATKDDVESLLGDNNKPTKEYVNNAFKSPRVIMGHSIEMLGKGVLDFRILHRFGMIRDGFSELFGFDQASMRIGFDYGVSKNLTIGIGRSSFHKEADGFVKYRIAHQSKGSNSFPLSIVWASGYTTNSSKITNDALNQFSNRVGYFHQLIAGRKLGDKYTLQLSPTLVHRNLVDLKSDKNDMIAVGIGARVKLSNRTALILDTYPIVYGARDEYNMVPLSIGFDIETGGHVFQLHLSNARGMNERAFITETTEDWTNGEFQLGFNLSRVFTVVKNKSNSW